MNDNEMRKLLEAAFEPHGDGYVYYRNNFSPGLPVTAEEREGYIKRWSPTAIGAFHHRIKGRAPVTPPRGLSGGAAVTRALPWWFVSGSIVTAALVALQAAVLENAWLRNGGFAFAGLLLAMAFLTFVRKLRLRKT